MLPSLRSVKFGDIITHDDHNSLVDSVKAIFNESVIKNMLPSEVLSELSAKISSLRYVRDGDYILADDHNSLVDVCKELYAIAHPSGASIIDVCNKLNIDLFSANYYDDYDDFVRISAVLQVVYVLTQANPNILVTSAPPSPPPPYPSASIYNLNNVIVYCPIGYSLIFGFGVIPPPNSNPTEVLTTFYNNVKKIVVGLIPNYSTSRDILNQAINVLESLGYSAVETPYIGFGHYYGFTLNENDELEVRAPPYGNVIDVIDTSKMKYAYIVTDFEASKYEVYDDSFKKIYELNVSEGLRQASLDNLIEIYHSAICDHVIII